MTLDEMFKDSLQALDKLPGNAGSESKLSDLLEQPIFLINRNYNPDHNYIPDWWEYTVGDYIKEYQISIDDFNDMIKAGAVKLKAF